MTATAGNLAAEPLCRVDITLDADAPIGLGRSPWRNRRVSYIAGGTVTGPRLNGVVRPGGGDWSEGGMAENGDALTYVEVRSLWTTDDGADIYVTYTGRLIIPAGVLGAFRDPAKIDALDPSAYYFRIAPFFETADPRYDWLNRAMAVGKGTRTARGVIYDISLVA